MLNKGKIVQIGTAAELLFSPVTEFVSDFLKEQRFQLELESILIKDVWHTLPKAIDKVDEKSIPPDTNLWSALETLSLAKNSKSFAASIGNERKQVDTASIMLGYHHYKSAKA